jgi:hypothetical protein
MLRHRLQATVAVWMAAVLVGGCGGGDDEGNGSDSAAGTPSPTATANGGKQGAGEGSSKARARIRVARAVPGRPPELGDSARVAAEDRVQFVIGASRTGDGSPVTIEIPRGPGRRLEAMTSAAAGESRATLRSATGDAIVLEDVRYSCTMPPTTACPAENVRTTDDAYELTFSLRDGEPPVILSGRVAEGR